MLAWNELQEWLMLHVGSKEAEECSTLVDRIAAEAQHASEAASIVPDCWQILND